MAYSYGAGGHGCAGEKGAGSVETPSVSNGEDELGLFGGFQAERTIGVPTSTART